MNKEDLPHYAFAAGMSILLIVKGIGYVIG